MSSFIERDDKMSNTDKFNWKTGYDSYETYEEAELNAKYSAAQGRVSNVWKKVATVQPFVANVEVTKVTA